MKKYFLWAIIIAIVINSLLGVIIWTYHNISIEKAKEKVQEPQVTYGEFPFKLIYRINDEIVTIEDVFICEYQGIKWNWNIGSYPVWKGYIESTGEDLVSVMDDGEYNIVITVGFAEYYMGLAPSSKFPWTPQFAKTGPKGSGLGLSYEEALSQYAIEILSFEHADPINNQVME